MNYHNVVFETSYGKASQLGASDLVEIAFAGRSNVGKSSLINKIFNRKSLARVSAVPGKTATINFFRLENVRFADLPGYGYAKVSQSEKQRWSDLIETYFNSDRRIGLVFQLIDMRHPPTRDDLMMVDFLIECELPFVVVLTKKDKLSKKQQEERPAARPVSVTCDDVPEEPLHAAEHPVTVVPEAALPEESVPEPAFEPVPVQELPEEPEDRPEPAAEQEPAAPWDEAPAPQHDEPEVRPAPAKQESAEELVIPQPEQSGQTEYVFPPVSLLTPRREDSVDATSEMRENSQRLADTLKSFGIEPHIVALADITAVCLLLERLATSWSWTAA